VEYPQHRPSAVVLYLAEQPDDYEIDFVGG
jgi:hypothetical protein